MGGRTSKSGFSGNKGTRSGEEIDIETRTGIVNPYDDIDGDKGGILSSNWGEDPQNEVARNAKESQKQAYSLANEVAKVPFEGLGFYDIKDVYEATGMGTKKAKGMTDSTINMIAQIKNISHEQAEKEVRDKQNEALQKRKKLGELFRGNIGKDRELWRHFSGAIVDIGTDASSLQIKRMFSDYMGGKINQKEFVKKAKTMKDYGVRKYHKEESFREVFGDKKVSEYKSKYGERWIAEIIKEE